MKSSRFDERAPQSELMDNLALDDPALTRNLRELEAVNCWLGGKATLISALDKVYENYSREFGTRTITIADLGCGGGDLLLTIHEWARGKQLSVRLIGVDANPFMVRYAAQKTQALDKIEFATLNVFSDSFQAMKFDIACLNTFCHHFGDSDLVSLLRQLDRQTSMALIVNDLHRHWIAYVSIKWISRMLNFSYLAKHDGPLSVLRAFRKKELIDLIRVADIGHCRIRWRWAFRWEIIVWKK